MKRYVYFDLSQAKGYQMTLPDGYEPCYVCNGWGWLEHEDMKCEECDGTGQVRCDPEPPAPENAPPINDPSMYDRPLL